MRATRGSSRRSWAHPAAPGRSASSSSRATRAITSAVPRCTRTRWPWVTSHGEAGRTVRRAVRRSDARQPSPETRVWPRCRSSRSTPASATAVREPAAAVSTSRPWVWSPRTRASGPPGRMRTRSPTARDPDHSVPVITEPVPRMVKARSRGRRGRSSSRRPSPAGGASVRSRSVSRRASTPSPRSADVATRGASGQGVASSRSRTSSRTRASQSGSSTRSALVRATTRDGTPRRATIWRCSRVWGMTPSSAATTSRTASTPVAPATMVRMKSSCPGTSTTATLRSPSVSSAKPRSMVMPRRFSSSSRSVSTPVRARTRAVLPWSM